MSLSEDLQVVPTTRC